MYMYILTILNVVSSKTLKPGATASPDLPDPRQAAVSVRTTRGRATKGVATGQFECSGIHVHVHFDNTFSM